MAILSEPSRRRLSRKTNQLLFFFSFGFRALQPFFSREQGTKHDGYW